MHARNWTIWFRIRITQPNNRCSSNYQLKQFNNYRKAQPCNLLLQQQHHAPRRTGHNSSDGKRFHEWKFLHEYWWGLVSSNLFLVSKTKIHISGITGNFIGNSVYFPGWSRISTNPIKAREFLSHRKKLDSQNEINCFSKTIRYYTVNFCN